MKQRADARAAKFLRPKFVQMIEWKFDAHLILLLQQRKSSDLVVASAVTAALSFQAFAAANASTLLRRRIPKMIKMANRCYHCASLRKQLAMSRVKRQLVFGRNLDLAREHAFGERAASVISQHLSDAAEFVDKTGHPGIRCPHHRDDAFPHIEKSRSPDAAANRPNAKTIRRL